MQTQSELMNELAGANIFAVRCDGNGLPIDGWAVPSLSIIDNHWEKTITVTLGTFRVESDRVVRKSANKTLSMRDFRDDRDMLDKLRRQLFVVLVDDINGVTPCPNIS